MKETNIWQEMRPCLLAVSGIVIFLLLFLAAVNQDKLILTEGSIKVITYVGAGNSDGEGLKGYIMRLRELGQLLPVKIMAYWQKIFGI